MGVVCDDFLKDETFSEGVYFQDGTDQDYDLHIWPKSPYFHETIDRYKDMDDGELKGIIDWYDPADTDRDYYLRSAIFSIIERDLEIENLLDYNDSETGRYEKFVMSVPVGDPELFRLRIFADARYGNTEN